MSTFHFDKGQGQIKKWGWEGPEGPEPTPSVLGGGGGGKVEYAILKS